MTTNNSSYTHGYHRSVLRSHNNRTVENSAGYLLARLSAGKHLLDIGSDEWMAWYQQAARANGGAICGRIVFWNPKLPDNYLNKISHYETIWNAFQKHGGTGPQRKTVGCQSYMVKYSAAFNYLV